MLKHLLTAAKGLIAGTEPTSSTDGVNVSIDQTALHNVVETYWPFIEHRINNIQVPDLVLPSDSEMYMKENSFEISQPISAMYKKNDVENNCYYIYLYDLTGKFETRNFHAHHGILGAHGSAHISMDSTHLGFGY